MCPAWLWDQPGSWGYKGLSCSGGSLELRTTSLVQLLGWTWKQSAKEAWTLSVWCLVWCFDGLWTQSMSTSLESVSLEACLEITFAEIGWVLGSSLVLKVWCSLSFCSPTKEYFLPYFVAWGWRKGDTCNVKPFFPPSSVCPFKNICAIPILLRSMNWFH